MISPEPGLASRHPVRYRMWDGELRDHPGDRFDDVVREIASRAGVTRVCELGAGANPILTREFVARQGIEYTLVDISRGELDKAPEGFAKIVADVTLPGLDGLGKYDFVFSRTLAEHVRHPVPFHRNILELLTPGGRAAHFFPTLYEPVFLVNWLMPERLAHYVLVRLDPYRAKGGPKEKFPAYYRWCRGPTQRQCRRLTGMGYEIEEYVGWFGHDYFGRAPALHRAQTVLARALAAKPLPLLTTYAWVVVRKGDG